MIRLFDLGSLFRSRALNLFRDGALTIPGAVSARDQESVLALLQQRGAPTPLERVEVDACDGLLQPAQTLLERVVWEGRAGEVLLVLRDVADASLREALLADERVRAFRCVVLVVPPPGGGESLGAWGELLLAVRDAVRDAYAARCLDLGLNPAALDPWQDVIASLQNPCDAVALVNAVVDLQLEAGDPRHTEVIVTRRVVMRELAWRAADEVMVLLAIASAREALITRELGEGVLEAAKARLVAQQLWHPEDGLLGWASLLLDARCWEGALGTPGGLPSNIQRAEGWGATHEDLGRHLGYSRYERPRPDASSFVRDAHRALQQFVDGEMAVAQSAARGLERRFPHDDASADAAWRMWALRAHLASVDARAVEASGKWSEAIRCAKTADVGAETLSNLLVEASFAEVDDAARAVSLSLESVEVLSGAPGASRTRAGSLLRVSECLLVAQRPIEAVTYASRSVQERLIAGAPRAAVFRSRVTLARALLSADNFTKAREVARMAEVECVGVRDTQHVLPTLRGIQATLAVEAKDFSAFETAVRDWVAARRAIGSLESRHVQFLRGQANLIRGLSPSAAQTVEALAAEVEAEVEALAARRLRPRP